jgi:hypothetical protein
MLGDRRGGMTRQGVKQTLMAAGRIADPEHESIWDTFGMMQNEKQQDPE